MRAKGARLILIGHRDHQEIVGTSGEAPDQTIVVGSVEEVDELEVPDPIAACFPDADHAFALRHAGNCGSAAPAVPVDCGPARTISATRRRTARKLSRR